MKIVKIEGRPAIDTTVQTECTESLLELIDELRDAVRLGEVEATTLSIKDGLSRRIHERRLELPERFLAPKPESYARRLLHRDPELGFTALVMVWGPAQRTMLHDHSGIWCVEGVVEGEMHVTRYELLEEGEEGLCRFAEHERLRAGAGSSGALIPPLEYHVLANSSPDRPAVTLHVYGGEMDHCTVFEPLPDGRHRRCLKALAYDV